MNGMRDQQEVNVLASHVALESGRCLVVESLELGFEAAGGEEGVGACVGDKDLGTGLGFHGLDVNEVTVVVIDDEHVAVAIRRGLYEATGEVGEDLAGGGGKVSINEVCAEPGEWWEEDGSPWRCRWRWGSWRWHCMRVCRCGVWWIGGWLVVDRGGL